MSKVTPFVWFNDNAGEAVEFYLDVFPNARRLGGLTGPDGKVVTVSFELEGQEITALNGGPSYALTPAFSLVVSCETQAEIDGYWDKLMDGGKAMACGWLTDKFGLSWQVCRRTLRSC